MNTRQSGETGEALDVAVRTEVERSASGATAKRLPKETWARWAGIYFVQCNGSDGPIKIGFARDVHARVSHLQSGCPYELRLIGSCNVADGAVVEARLHRLFDGTRLRGEWFAYSPELVALALRCEAYQADVVAAQMQQRAAQAPPRELVEDRAPRGQLPVARRNRVRHETPIIGGQFTWRGKTREG